MDTPTITYVAAWATAATAGGTLALAGATYWLATCRGKTHETRIGRGVNSAADA